jgi:hypothetical protein
VTIALDYVVIIVFPLIVGFFLGVGWEQTVVEGRRIKRELDEQADRLGHPEWRDSRA